MLAILGLGRPKPGSATLLGAVSGGGQHTCALLSDGTAKCWGWNGYGQLGDGTTAEHHTPVTVSGLTDAVAISAGTSHTCALLNDGTAKCWGWNGDGQLGDGTTADHHTPVTVSGLNNVIAINAAGNHTCALFGDGSMRCWGENSHGQLGDGTTMNRSNPVAVSNLSNAVAIGGGEYHTCAVLNDGTVRCWGFNSFGQLGDGTLISQSAPVTVSGLNNATGIAPGRSFGHTCVLLADATVKCWGFNNNGQLGDGTNVSQSSPVAVSGLSNVIAVVIGWEHSCALLSDGTAKCWGAGYGGSPVPVSGLSNAVAIATGWNHTCALLSDGSAQCWGFNGYGQLGDGTTTDSVSPVNVLDFQACIPPGNDYFANAAGIGAEPFSANTSTMCASSQTSEPQPCASIGSTVWYSYTPSQSVMLQVDTAGSDYDSALAVYTGSDLGDLTNLACDDDSGPGLTSLITFDAIAGTTYHFQVGGFAGSRGDLSFTLLAPTPTPTPTDTGTPTPTATPCPPGMCTPTPTPTFTPTSVRSAPKASIDETANGQQGPITLHVGDSVTFRWVVTNSGDRPMYANVVDDALPNLDGDCSLISAGNTCEKSVDVTLSTPGVITNFATVNACGIPPWPDHCQGAWDNDYVKVNVVDRSASASDPAVGGIAEAPDMNAPPPQTAGSTSPPYAALTGAGAAVIVLGAGGWYARRRWRKAR